MEENIKKYNYSFIGFGNLAEAVYSGLSSTFTELNFGYIDRKPKEIEIKNFESYSELIGWSDVIFLTVKPQDLTKVLHEIKTEEFKKKLLISPVAGRTIQSIEKELGSEVNIVRIMPNLAIKYNLSVTGLKTNISLERNIKTDPVIHELYQNFQIYLKTLGKVVVLKNEEQFNIFTALFGSGPGFVLELITPFLQQCSKAGVNKKEAEELVELLLYGTVMYMRRNDLEVKELIKRVKSKGGVTEAGLKTADELKIHKLITQMLEAAELRSKELSV